MKWLNCEKMKLLLIVFVAAMVLDSGSVKADFIWAQKADMPTPRCAHTSAVVNGKIYVIGGFTSEGLGEKALSTTEEYDPSTDTWTRKADMPTARCDFVGSSAVVDGKIYVIGGDVYDGSYWTIPTVEEYDPATDTWTKKTDMPTPRWCVATCTFEGKIYAIGGYPTVGYTALTTVEVYDPISDTWTKQSDMPLNRGMLSASVVNGKIYAVGGRPRYYAEPSVQEYDPSTDTWMQKRDMPVATSQMGSVVMGNKIVVIGGWEISTKYPYTKVQVYDTVTDTWTLEEDVPFLRASYSAELVDNRVYLIGGTDRPHPCPSLSTVYTNEPIVDFNGDGVCDINDLVIMIENWNTDNSLCDIGPTPFGDGIVDKEDLKVFMSYWGQEVNDPTLIAHWPLDEIEGDIVYDSSGHFLDANVIGDPLWQPEAGMIDGAIELDGIDDYVITPFVLNPRETSAFSVFAWIKGGLPGQIIISQANSADWLSIDTEGCLMTELKGGRGASDLISDVVITDGNWHRIGFTWDGDYRILYVDDVIATIDTQNALPSSEEGLYIGAGKNLEPGTFFSGLIDDVGIYNRVITP